MDAPTAPPAALAAAFAPGHVTGLFVPSLDARDPRGRGSTGAGLVLPLGARARARWRPGKVRPVRIASDLGRPLPISSEVARRLVGPAKGSLEVFLSHELPVGRGFGMSAAGALATALATAEVMGQGRQRAIEIAHLADLYGGGGLGGVAAILGGGFELRAAPGVPPWGRVLHRRWTERIWIAPLGPPLPSRPLLRSARFRERVRKIAEGGLARLRIRPSLRHFFDEAERFSDELALTPQTVARTIAELRASGARASQAMLGRTVFAFAPNVRVRGQVERIFESMGVRALELPLAVQGARRLRLHA